MVSFFDSPFSFYEALGDYCERHGLCGIGQKREERYRAALGFWEEWLNAGAFMTGRTADGRLLKMSGGDLQRSVTVLKSLLCFDYYLRENAKSRPDWAGELPIEKKAYQNFFRQGGNGEFCLNRPGYDSKAAARRMHIEPVCGEALRWIASDVKLCGRIEEIGKQAACYCLFDYENRNPLSKGAQVTVFSRL